MFMHMNSELEGHYVYIKYSAHTKLQKFSLYRETEILEYWPSLNNYKPSTLTIQLYGFTTLAHRVYQIRLETMLECCLL